MGFYALPSRLLPMAPTLDYSEYAGYRPIFDSIYTTILKQQQPWRLSQAQVNVILFLVCFVLVLALILVACV